jgi:tetratricopeptide (TPR) repeat protein
MAAWAALAIARDEALPVRSDEPVDAAAARAGYTHVMETYPGTAAAEEAFLYRTELLIRSRSPDDARHAISELTDYLRDHPASHETSTLQALLSKACETGQDYPGALRAAIASVDVRQTDPANPRQNNILEYYRIGLMAQFDVGDFATARRYYQKFLTDYPRDQRAFTVELLLKHLDATEAALREGKLVPELSDLARPATKISSAGAPTAGKGGGGVP